MLKVRLITLAALALALGACELSKGYNLFVEAEVGAVAAEPQPAVPGRGER